MTDKRAVSKCVTWPAYAGWPHTHQVTTVRNPWSYELRWPKCFTDRVDLKLNIARTIFERYSDCSRIPLFIAVRIIFFATTLSTHRTAARTCLKTFILWLWIRYVRAILCPKKASYCRNVTNKSNAYRSLLGRWFCHFQIPLNSR